MEEERGRKYECFSLLKEKVIMDSVKLKETETERKGEERRGSLGIYFNHKFLAFDFGLKLFSEHYDSLSEMQHLAICECVLNSSVLTESLQFCGL